MKINQINNCNVNFGYNKKVNNTLSQKLQSSEQTPVIQTMKMIQENCLFAEDQIKKLEGKKLTKTEENENQINILSQYLISAKPVLCVWTDRLFPELKYTIKEYDTYNDEITKNIPNNYVRANKAFYWRNDLTEKIEEYLEEMAQIDYSRIDDSIEISMGTQTENQQNTTNNTNETNTNKPVESKQTNNHNAAIEKLVTKYTPYSYSPKSLDEVVGINDIKEDIELSLIFSLKNPEGAIEREKDYGVKSANFVILYGPPGCGKTMLAEAISAETNCDMYKLDLSNFGTSYINETAVNIKRAFEYVSDIAKQSDKPVLLFMDEMDSILSERKNGSTGSKEDNKVVNTILPLLSSLEDNESNLVVIGATNMYDMLDPAAKSRADNKYYIGLPNEKEIQRLLNIHLSKLRKGENLANNEQELKQLAGELKNYSPRDIVKIIQNAGKKASVHGGNITKKDFDEALKVNSFEKTNENEYKPANKKVSSIGFMK